MLILHPFIILALGMTPTIIARFLPSLISLKYLVLMKNKLMPYLEKNKILNDSQYGFRSGSSIYHALNLFSSHLYSSLDSKLSVLSIFIDLSKAFDTVNHRITLDKLYHYGIHGTINSWFKDYLTNRSQCTIFDGHISLKLNISTGVPQGSVLGPILFLIYINDIVKVFDCAKSILFADDMTLYFTGSHNDTLFHLANQDLNKLHNWCLSNRLTINNDKTHFILFSNKDTTVFLWFFFLGYVRLH